MEPRLSTDFMCAIGLNRRDKRSLVASSVFFHQVRCYERDIPTEAHNVAAGSAVGRDRPCRTG